ncbi:hypothetical protein TELCIR_05478, partial [Teladorsagia circumcincta]
VTSIIFRTYNNATEADILTHHDIPNMRSYPVVNISNIRQADFYGAFYMFHKCWSILRRATSAVVKDVPAVLYSMFCCTILLIPIYATMYICRCKIYSLLKKERYSKQTKLMAKQFVKALTLQSIVPVLATFPAAIVYALLQFGIVDDQLPSYLIVPFLSIGSLLDPIITIYCVQPYRIYVKHLLMPCIKISQSRLSAIGSGAPTL